MAKARPRFIITGNMRSNDVDLKGLRVILMGECNWTGSTKSRDGKRLLKRELTHWLFKFEDKRFAKLNNTAGDTLTVEKTRLNAYYTLAE